MAKFITLKQIIEEADTETVQDRRPFAEDDGEDDGLPQSQAAPPAREVQYANAGHGPGSSFQAWKPNTMQVDAIRNFYPRKGGRNGSRVVMKTGTAYIVVDTHEEILAMINA